MKTNYKFILPLLLISTLLLLFVGCVVTPSNEEPGVTGTGTIIGTIASPCCSLSADPVTETCCVSPEYWCYYCQQNWSLQDGIEVVLTYGEDIVAITTTNADGEYIFNNVSPGSNYVVTAYCPDYTDNRPLVKDVALEVASTFDAKITDLASTSLGLVVDFLVYYTEWGPEDISLDAVIADKPTFPNFPKFKALIYEVRRVVENCELNLLTDDDVQYATCRAAEEISGLDIGCGPGATPTGPTPTPDPCAVNSPPYDVSLVDPFPSVVVGETYSGKVIASDDGIKDPLIYSWTVGFLPPGDMEINPGTGAITWNPTCDDICYCTDQLVDMGRKSKPNNGCTPNIIKVTVDDGCKTVDAEFCIEVTNQAPVITDITNAGWDCDRFYASAIATCDATYQVEASDPDACQTVLHYSLEGDVPNGMTIDENSGLITWDPVPCPPGPWVVTVKVEDECKAYSTVILEVTATNAAPTILNITNTVTFAVPPVEQYNASAIATCDATYQVEASDPDACQTVLHYSLEGDVPNGMTIDENSGLITWDPVPCPSEGPTWMVTVKVMDGCDAEDTVTLRATATNAAPTILNITNTVTFAVPPVEQYNASAIATCDANYQVEASDPDACQTVLHYSLEGDVPNGMTIDENSGLITWDPVPCPSEGPTWMVTVKVMDGCDAEDTVTLRATATNVAPTITNVEFTNEFTSYQCCECICVVIEDSKTLHIKVTAEDPDDCQTLTFSLNAEDGDPPLPPVGLIYEQVGNEFTIDFNANCYDQCIDCEAPPDGDKGERCSWICDCWWGFMIRVTDGCDTEDVCIWVCVADWIQ